MNPLVFSLISFTVMLGTMIVLISSHWLMIWIGFEMNMLAITPMLMKNFNPRSMEAATKYFLTQATASMLLMLAIIINLTYSGQWTTMKMTDDLASTMMTIAMIMKLGMAPFHFWVPEVTQGVPLTSGMILLTWQKIAPLSVLMQTAHSINTNLMLTTAMLSIAVGGWGGLNQTQLRKIMAYSSIAHMGWMAAIMTYNTTMTTLNLIIYVTLTLTVFMLLYINSSTTTLSLSHLWNKMPLMSTLILLTMLSLGGLPPLSGFLPKWMIINELTKNGSIILPTIMAVTALLNLYFYMRLTYSTSLTMFPSTNNMKMKWQFENMKKTPMLSPLVILSTMLLPLTPMLLILE
ncbi:NADH dehydrogenase subunit 2 (mitochondrion) [Talpa occidentalis]|uniref:NADH-ubiquinone oxidoreductase chain 2 n=1 Tax=Talpa occidentalis TaxID=50954 RepID=A0A346RBZ6_TALOC|nr:NADH dehydrogenase subunit 2 [Talpa occidentalis]AXS63593.1 NADH dehydrogenase subunit 2 [Talpa occidentalis]